MRKIAVLFLVLLLLPCVALANEMGYDSLAERGGEPQQALYRRMLNDLTAFGSGDSDAPADGIILEYTCKETGLTSDQIAEVYNMVLTDHPEIYFTSADVIYQYSQEMVIGVLPECASAADRRAIEDTIETNADRLLSSYAIRSATTAYKKALAVHDAIIEWTDYDLEAPMQHTIAGLLVNKKAVCDGYAKTYSYLLDKIGVNSLVVHGYAGEPHAWNIIQMEDGSWITADVTWDDFGGVAHDYFDMTPGVFAMSHKVDTPEQVGMDYYFDLPDMGIPSDPVPVYAEGIWDDPGEPIGAEMTYEQIVSRMIGACSRAIEEGTGGFSIAVDEAAKEQVSYIMDATLSYGEKTMYFFDIHMQEDVRSAGVYGGLTEERTHQDGRMTYTFYTWQHGTATPSIAAHADGHVIGNYYTLAQAYAAGEKAGAELLELDLTATEIYALPVLSSPAEGMNVCLRGDHAFATLIVCGPFRLNGDMELCNIRIWPAANEPLEIDLGSHSLTLGDRIEIGRDNLNAFFGAPDNSSLNLIHGGEGSALINDRGTGKDVIRDIYSSIDVDRMILREGYLNLRGGDTTVHVNDLYVEESDGYPALSVGSEGSTDRVTMVVENFKNTGNDLHLDISEGQKLTIRNIQALYDDNGPSGGITYGVSKYSLLEQGDPTGLPEFSIEGLTGIHYYFCLTYTTPDSSMPLTISDILPVGTVIMHAPGLMSNGQTDYMLNTNNGSKTAEEGKLIVEKTKDGDFVIVGYGPK